MYVPCDIVIIVHGGAYHMSIKKDLVQFIRKEIQNYQKERSSEEFATRNLCSRSIGSPRPVDVPRSSRLTEVQGVQGPPGAVGPPGPRGPKGTSGTNIKLFVTEEQGGAKSLPLSTPTDFPIMNVQVTTNEENERVKINGIVSTSVLTVPSERNFQIALAFRLFRDHEFLTSTSIEGSFERPVSLSRFYEWHPYHHFVDVPGPLGTYTYEIRARHLIPPVNVDDIIVRNLGFTAEVFSPI